MTALKTLQNKLEHTEENKEEYDYMAFHIKVNI